MNEEMRKQLHIETVNILRLIMKYDKIHLIRKNHCPEKTRNEGQRETGTSNRCILRLHCGAKESFAIMLNGYITKEMAIT